MLQITKIPVETFYQWKVFSAVESPIEGKPPENPRLLTPWGDSNMNFQWTSCLNLPKRPRNGKQKTLKKRIGCWFK